MPFDPTPEQLTILSHDPTRHGRVLAGPGTGKSTTMVMLLAKLLEKKASLRIRMLTFTRAATAELADKIAGLPAKLQRPSTIHSFAVSVLLKNPGTAGFPEPLRIADTWEFNNVVRETLAKRAGVGVRVLDKLIQEMASNWQSLIDEKDPEVTDADRARFRGAWDEHRRILGYTLLQELPYALRRALNDHDDLDGIDFDLLLVDEYQDLNACDLEVLKLLSDKAKCAVLSSGDDDQSVYSWRKAAPEGIRRFLTDYAGAVDYPLSVSQRCGKRIIGWANSVIQGDPDRPRDRAILVPPAGAADGEVALLSFKSEIAEAKGVADLLRILMAKGIEPKDILILTRTDYKGAFSKPIRKQLEALGIPCTDPAYVETLLAEGENRRFLELLHLLVDPDDSISWASLLRLTAGVGTIFFEYIYDRAKAKGNPFARELLDAYEEGFPDAPASATKVKTEVAEILSWIEKTELPDEPPPGGWGSWITDIAGIEKAIRPPSPEFLSFLCRLDAVTDPAQSLGRYLGQIEPLGKDLAQSEADGVRVMKMSASKGLTVRATIIAGVEDGLVPRPKCDLSEERRILYVAMTRARDYLYCTWAKRRQGPTARAGVPSMVRRRHSDFLNGGGVASEDGEQFLRDRARDT